MSKSTEATTAPRSRRVACKIPSQKLGRIVPVNSFLARDCVLILEYDQEVAFYREQPCKINFRYDGKVRMCAPDFLVVDRTGNRWFIRLKPVSRAIAEDDTAFYKTVLSVCREQGFDFVIIHESDIRQQPRLNNISILRRYSLTELGIRHRILCREFFRLSPVQSLGALIAFCRDQGITSPEAIAYALLWHNVISTDLNRLLDEHSQVQPVQSATGDVLGDEVERC